MGKLNAQGEMTERTAEKKLPCGTAARKWIAFFSFLMTDRPPPPLSLGSGLNEADTSMGSVIPGATKGDRECGPGEVEEEEGRKEGWEERGARGRGNLTLLIKAKPARNQSTPR